MQVDKLNAIISSAEKDMLRLRRQYEVVIEARNYTGIMLIDRNDELCIMWAWEGAASCGWVVEIGRG